MHVKYKNIANAIMIAHKPSYFIVALFVLSVAVLATAWGFELIGGYAPCPLCLQQRWAYYFAIGVCMIALLALKLSMRKIALVLISLVGFFYLYNSGLGLYHAGVEWQFWLGPAECSGAISEASGSLIDRINSQRIVLCNEAPWRFLGLSFAGYNMLISFGLAVLSFAIALRGYYFN